MSRVSAPNFVQFAKKPDVTVQELDPAQTTTNPTNIGSTIFYVAPDYTRITHGQLKINVTNLLVSPRHGITSAEAKDDTLEDDLVLSPEQLKLVLDQLQNQLQKTKSSRPKGATFEVVRSIVERNPNLAIQLHSMIEMGAKPDVAILSATRIVFDDLRTDDEVSLSDAIRAELAVLKAIPDKVKNRIIAELRSENPNIIPDNAFERSGTNLSGPNYWESLLLTRAKKLRIMPPNDYKATQNQLFGKDRLDMQGISWLEATDEERKSGIAPNGNRNENDVYVDDADAEVRRDRRGVRVRAEGSVAS